MAFGDTRNAQFNKSIQRLLDYFLEQKLMKQRYGMMGELETQQQAGSTALETQRLAGAQALESTEHKNLIDRMKQAWDYQISRDPVTNRYQSEIFIKKRAGEDTSGLEGELETKLSTDAQGLIKLFEGKLDQSSMRTIARFPDDTMRSLLGEYGATTRQTEQITKIGEPGIRQRQEEIGLRRDELGVRRGELRAKGQEQVGKFTDKQKAYISLVERTQDYLRSQGVQPTENRQQWIDMSAGKALAPLSPENYGTALQHLNEILEKLIGGDLPNAGELRFLTTIVNTATVEGTPAPGVLGGGLVSPETGLRPREEVNAESSVQANAENLYATKIMQRLGWGEERRADALRLAREFFTGLK